jgi:hypothetical protein
VFIPERDEAGENFRISHSEELLYLNRSRVFRIRWAGHVGRSERQEARTIMMETAFECGHFEDRERGG